MATTTAAAAVARSGRTAASRIPRIFISPIGGAFIPPPRLLTFGSRAVHSSGAKQMGSHAGPSYDDYIHAEHMYNLQAMKNRRMKMGLGVFGSLAVGTFLPIFAVMYAQKKVKSS